MEVAGFARIDLVRLDMSVFSELCCKALESANLNVLSSSSCTFSNLLGSLKEDARKGLKGERSKGVGLSGLERLLLLDVGHNTPIIPSTRGAALLSSKGDVMTLPPWSEVLGEVKGLDSV